MLNETFSMISKHCGQALTFSGQHWEAVWPKIFRVSLLCVYYRVDVVFSRLPKVFCMLLKVLSYAIVQQMQAEHHKLGVGMLYAFDASLLSKSYCCNVVIFNLTQPNLTS